MKDRRLQNLEREVYELRVFILGEQGKLRDKISMLYREMGLNMYETRPTKVEKSTKVESS